MIEVIEQSTRTEFEATFALVGAPEVRAAYVDRVFLPHWMKVTYRHKGHGASGRWLCISVLVAGFRVLKPGADGSQRIGKEQHDREWHLYSEAHCVSEDPKTPEWVQKLANDLRPSGHVTGAPLSGSSGGL